MDLRAWVIGEHQSVLSRFEQSVVSVVPLERWRDAAGQGGSSIAWLAFHTAFHEDLAVNAAVRGEPLLLTDWRQSLGVGGIEPHVGLGETEQTELTKALDLDQLVPYVRAVHDRTAEWLGRIDLGTFEIAPASTERLSAAGVEERAAPWLYRMWDGKPTSWFVQWEAIGHRVNHVGEMVSVRNRLGLSPF
jgi:DinB superfamily